MKGRESGMPEEAYWNSFFDAEGVLDSFLNPETSNAMVVEFGSGYGTFTLPIAMRVTGTVTALDIEPVLVTLLDKKAKAAGRVNIKAQERDFMIAGSGLDHATQHYALIFNLLHIESPELLLAEAYRILKPGGKICVMHWRCDIDTPRGPPLKIRPTPEQSAAWIRDAGFASLDNISLAGCAPYHYGLAATK